MQEKQKIRLAIVNGYVLPKKCRKEQWRSIEGRGINDDEAIQNLKIKFHQSKENWKQYTMKEIKIQDAIVTSGLSYEGIQFSIFPTVEGDNLTIYDISFIDQ